MPLFCSSQMVRGPPKHAESSGGPAAGAGAEAVIATPFASGMSIGTCGWCIEGGAVGREVVLGPTSAVGAQAQLPRGRMLGMDECWDGCWWRVRFLEAPLLAFARLIMATLPISLSC